MSTKTVSPDQKRAGKTKAKRRRATPPKLRRKRTKETLPDMGVAEGIVRRALMLAANEIDAKTGQTRIRLAADAMVRKALDGNVEAFKVIADRIDGKPKQQVDMTGNLAVTSLGEAHLAALQALTQVITKENNQDTSEVIDVTPTKLDSEDS